jgi:hypothetical protein
MSVDQTSRSSARRGDRPVPSIADPWVSTEVAARLIGGVTPRWVRVQIDTRRLRARALLTGRRVTYRIHLDDLDRFTARYVLDDAGGYLDEAR